MSTLGIVNHADAMSYSFRPCHALWFSFSNPVARAKCSHDYAEPWLRVRLLRSLMLYGVRGARGAPTLCCDSVMAVGALSEAQQSLLR